MAVPLKLQIVVDDKGVRVLDQVGNKVQDVGRKGTQTFGAMGEGANRMNGYLERSIALYNRLMVAAGALYTLDRAWDMMKTSARAAQERQAFEALAASYNTNADQIVADLKRASAQTVDTMTLIQKAGTAMMMGINPDELSRLMEIARATSRMTGQSVTKAFEDISLAVGRQSRMILDNLGIIVKVGEANERYAAKLGKTANDLTEAEKKQAFLNATLEAGEELMARMGDQAKSAAEHLQTMEAFAADLKTQLGEGLLFVLKWLLIAFAEMGAVVNRTLEQITGGWGLLMGMLGSLPGGEFLGFKALGEELQGLSEHFKEAREQGEAFARTLYDMKLSGGGTPPARAIPAPGGGGGGGGGGTPKEHTAWIDDIAGRAAKESADAWGVMAYEMGVSEAHMASWNDEAKKQSEFISEISAKAKEEEAEAWRVLAYEMGVSTEQMQAWEEQNKQSMDSLTLWSERTANAMEQNFSDFFFDLMRGEFESLGDVAEGVFMRIQRAAADYLGEALTNSLFGGVQAGTGSQKRSGGWLGGLLSLGGAILSGGTIGGGAAMSTSHALALVRHAGGPVDGSGPVRYVPAEIFGRAPRLHDGLMADEFPAILQKGETVIPKSGAGLRGVTVENVNVTVNALDAASFTEMTRRNPGAIVGPFLEALRQGGMLRDALREGVR